MEVAVEVEVEVKGEGEGNFRAFGGGAEETPKFPAFLFSFA